MRRKGSGRPIGSFKPIELVSEDLDRAIRRLDDDVYALYKAVEALTSRFRY